LKKQNVYTKRNSKFVSFRAFVYHDVILARVAAMFCGGPEPLHSKSKKWEKWWVGFRKIAARRRESEGDEEKGEPVVYYDSWCAEEEGCRTSSD